ncbi:MAG: SRPBCC family protein [Acidimicrobiia bacterium]|nr:SRPBCC family protein [Acidimicrobiia bacterium]
MTRTVEQQRTVGVPIGDVFDALGDLAAISTWGPDIDHAWVCTEAQRGVGAVRRVQTGRMVVLEEIVRWEPPHVLGYRIDGLPKVVRSVHTTWTLTPTSAAGGDATTVSVVTDIDCGPRPPQQLIARLLARKFTSVNAGLLEGFATFVTSQHRSST